VEGGGQVVIDVMMGHRGLRTKEGPSY
jgi:hypothetical protein